MTEAPYPAIAYVTFESSDKQYAYFCGTLRPEPGDLVVVQTNDGKLKVVRCVGLNTDDPKAVKQLYGVVLQQGKTA